MQFQFRLLQEFKDTTAEAGIIVNPTFISVLLKCGYHSKLVVVSTSGKGKKKQLACVSDIQAYSYIYIGQF